MTRRFGIWPYCFAAASCLDCNVCGKLKTDFRYSNTLGWNTFPVPTLTEKNKADLTRCAEDILLAREAHFPATIADLYDPTDMPDDLRAAHERNDEVLERIYIGRRFKNDTERLEKLFELYTKMTASSAATEERKKAEATLTMTNNRINSLRLGLTTPATAARPRPTRSACGRCRSAPMRSAASNIC